MASTTGPLLLDEPTARAVVLMQAIETVDTGGALLSEVERSVAERELLERRGLPAGQAPDPAWYLPARAAELLRIVGQREPGLPAIAHGQGWTARLAWGVPLVALLAGLLSDRIGNPRQLNLLSLPLLGFVLWNLVVYALLAASALLPRRAWRHDPLRRLRGEMHAWVSWALGQARTRWRSLVAPQFQVAWWRAAGPLEGARLQRVLHFSALAWALGVALSLVWAGLATQYRVGWESTWLDARQVHGIVSVVSAPGRALLGVEPFSLADVQRLHFDAGAKPTAGEARRWALLYVAFLVAVVMLPRLALGWWAGWQARRLAQRVPIDQDQPYFQQVMDRVSPVRLTVAVVAAGPHQHAVVQCILRQAAPEGPDLVLRTEQGDALRLDAPPNEATADLVWLLAASEADVGALGAAAPTQGPLLILCAAGLSPRALADQARSQGWQAEALGARESVACWALEEPLREALMRLLPRWKQAGVHRLMLQWRHQHERRWFAARLVLATALAAASRDSEKLTGSWPGARERQQAMTTLLARLQQRLDQVHSELLRIHAAEVLLRSGALQPVGGHLLDQVNQAHVGTAGALAGAAAGALAGAKIDLLAGGLTMGAGAALGALVGGAGAFGAARWRDVGGSVRLSDEQLQSLAESLVTQYLAVIHAGRSLDPQDALSAASWHSEAVAEVAARTEAWQQAWRAARQAPTEDEAAQALAAEVGQACSRVLRRLYPGQDLAPMAAPGDAPAAG